MVPQWGYKAALSTLLLWLFLSSGVCVEQDVKGSMYSSSLCSGDGGKVLWLSEKTNAIITGKSARKPRKQCKIVFGLASKNGNARLRIHFDSIYFRDCGVRLQINQSSSSDFDQPDLNKEMFLSGCHGSNPGPLYAQPRNYILVSLFKDSISSQDYNFRLNISSTEKLPISGPALHVVIIVCFVCIIVVVTAAILLLKYAVRVSYHWSEERREEVMTRAINLYNSSEPLEEESDMVLVQPRGSASESSHSGSGGQRTARDRRNGPEIAFVHSDGRIERFRPLGDQWQEQSSVAMPLHRPKPQKCHVNSSPVSGKRQPSQDRLANAESAEDPIHFAVNYPPHVPLNHARRNRAHTSEPASLCGNDLPPSYEEALDMPLPQGEGGHFQDSSMTDSTENLTGAVGGISNYHDSVASTTLSNSNQRIQTGNNTVSDRLGGEVKGQMKETAQDREELVSDPPNYMNIGGHLEMMDQDADIEEDAASPLLLPLTTE